MGFDGIFAEDDTDVKTRLVKAAVSLTATCVCDPAHSPGLQPTLTKVAYPVLRGTRQSLLRWASLELGSRFERVGD